MHASTSRFGVPDLSADIACATLPTSPTRRSSSWHQATASSPAALLDKHPHVEITVTDPDPMVVGNLTLSDLGNHPRALVCHMDAATAIDAPDSF